MKYLLIAILFSCHSSFAGSDSAGEEVVVSCLRANPVMYFSPATRAVSKKIIAQLKSSISSGKLKCEGQNSWLCAENEFSVFQGYDGRGKKDKFAMVCEGSAGESNFKYYSSEYLTLLGNCVNASWGGGDYGFN